MAPVVVLIVLACVFGAALIGARNAADLVRIVLSRTPRT